MSYRLVFTDSYNKKAAKWIKKHPSLKDQYLKTLQLMELDIQHPSLRLHKLNGKLSGLSSVFSQYELSHYVGTYYPGQRYYFDQRWFA